MKIRKSDDSILRQGSRGYYIYKTVEAVCITTVILFLIHSCTGVTSWLYMID